MGNNTKKASVMLQKSMWRLYKPKVFFIAIAILCFAFLLFLPFVRELTKKRSIQEAEAVYGDYQVSFWDLTQEQEVALKQETRLRYMEGQAVQSIMKDTGTLFYQSEDLFHRIGNEIIAGRFPKEPDEILCEPTYLRNQGIAFSEETTITVTIEDKTYRVTGIFMAHGAVSIAGLYMPSFVCNIDTLSDIPKEKLQYIFYARTRENYAVYPVVMALADQYALSSQQINYNHNVMIASGLNEKGKAENTGLYILEHMLYVFAVLMAVILLFIIRICSENWGRLWSISFGMGVPKKLLYQAGIWFFLKRVGSIALAVACVIEGLAVYYLGDWLLHAAQWVRLFTPGFFCLFLLLLGYVCQLYKRIRMVDPQMEDRLLLHKRWKKVPNGSELIGKNPYRVLGAKNQSLNRFLTIMKILGMVLAFFIMATMLELFRLSHKNEEVTSEYDAMVEFSYASPDVMFIKTQAMADTYALLREQEENKEIGYQVFSYFYMERKLQLPIADLSQEYVDYIMSTQQNVLADYYHSSDGRYGAHFYIVGADEKILKDTYGIEGVRLQRDTDCILVTHTMSSEGNGISTGLHQGAELVWEQNGQKVTFHVADEVDKIVLPTTDAYYVPIMIVSLEAYFKYFDHGLVCPKELFFKLSSRQDNGSLEELINSTPGMELFDLKQTNELVRRTYHMEILLTYGTMIFFIVLVLLNLYINMWRKIEEEREQSSILYALGVPLRHICNIIFGEYFIILAETAVFGCLLSAAGTYLVRYYIRRYSFYCILKVSWGIPLIGGALFLVVGILMFLPLLRKMREMNIRKELQEEGI